MRVTKELRVVRAEFSIFGNNGHYFLEDNDGNRYCWYTASDKMWNWYLYGETQKKLCKFTEVLTWDSETYGTVTKIKNVRF